MPWLLFAIAILLLLGLVAARGRIPRRRGFALIGAAVGLVVVLEALIAAEVLSADATANFYAVSVALVVGAAVMLAARARVSR